METLFYMLLIGAAAVVIVGLLVQMVGAFLVTALTVLTGIRDAGIGRSGPELDQRIS